MRDNKTDWREFDQNWGINLDKYEKTGDNKKSIKSYLKLPEWLKPFKKTR